MSAGARSERGWCGCCFFDAEDGREVAQSVIGVLEVEGESEHDVECRRGVVMTAGVEIARPTLHAVTCTDAFSFLQGLF